MPKKSRKWGFQGSNGTFQSINITLAEIQDTVGARFKKKFPGYGVWEGKVLSYEADKLKFECIYSDGTIEYNSLDQLKKYGASKPTTTAVGHARCSNNNDLYNNNVLQHRKSSHQHKSEAPSPGRVTNGNLNRAQQFIKDIRENPILLKDVVSPMLSSTIELIYETGASFVWTILDDLVQRCNLTQKQKNALIHSKNRKIVQMHHIYFEHAREDRIRITYVKQKK